MNGLKKGRIIQTLYEGYPLHTLDKSDKTPPATPVAYEILEILEANEDGTCTVRLKQVG